MDVADAYCRWGYSSALLVGSTKLERSQRMGPSRNCDLIGFDPMKHTEELFRHGGESSDCETLKFAFRLNRLLCVLPLTKAIVPAQTEKIR